VQLDSTDEGLKRLAYQESADEQRGDPSPKADALGKRPVARPEALRHEPSDVWERCSASKKSSCECSRTLAARTVPSGSWDFKRFQTTSSALDAKVGFEGRSRGAMLLFYRSGPSGGGSSGGVPPGRSALVATAT